VFVKQFNVIIVVIYMFTLLQNTKSLFRLIIFTNINVVNRKFIHLTIKTLSKYLCLAAVDTGRTIVTSPSDVCLLLCVD
jgi:hypothetical protein